jgi:cytochrome c1
MLEPISCSLDRNRPAAFLLILVFALFSCNYFRDFDFERGARLTGGDPELGRQKLARHSCISCHAVPGVPNAAGAMAPALTSWSKRRDFLNAFPNTPANLEAWLENPSRLKPGTTMPDMNVSRQDSRDIAAFLYSIN